MPEHSTDVSASPSLADTTRRRITQRLIPLLMILFILNQIDRVNISYAGLQMTRELKFSNEVFGFGSGIFFLGYCLFDVPGTMLVALWSARKIISSLVIAWGIVATASGLIHNIHDFYIARFLLGAAEAPFFPGLIVYLSHWFPAKGRAKAVAMFMTAMPIAQITGAPISAALLRVNWWGYSGWHWLLILEGLPAVVLGIFAAFYLTDYPKQAKWLQPEQREHIINVLAQEHEAKQTERKYSVWEAVRHRETILLSVVAFCGYTIQYGFTLWLPQMVQRLSGFTPAMVTLISAVPWLMSWPVMLFTGWNSDRTDERRWHVAIPLFVGAAGLGLARSTDSVMLGLVAFTIAAMGINGRLPAFWSLPNSLFTGTAAAAVIATMNFIGIFGGFVGPYIVGFLSNKTGTYTSAVAFLLGSAVLAGVLVLFIRPKKSY
jgi:MFS transporter, ACS family, tartrate transporter